MPHQFQLVTHLDAKKVPLKIPVMHISFRKTLPPSQLVILLDAKRVLLKTQVMLI
jgi:hypothetical protein